MAADLHKRGLLTGLEPETGSGSATHDLLATVQGQEYEIEVKEFVSNSPERRLAKEIENKIAQLPQNPTKPVIFHTVLSESREGRFDLDKEKKFLAAVDEMLKTLSPKISAVVVARCVVDSAGGRVKRDTIKTALNPVAIQPSNPSHLALLFEPNYEDMLYPCFGIGSLLYFGLQNK